MEEEIVSHMLEFNGDRKGKYFGEEPLHRTEMEGRTIKIKKGKATGKDEFSEAIIRNKR